MCLCACVMSFRLSFRVILSCFQFTSHAYFQDAVDQIRSTLGDVSKTWAERCRIKASALHPLKFRSTRPYRLCPSLEYSAECYSESFAIGEYDPKPGTRKRLKRSGWTKLILNSNPRAHIIDSDSLTSQDSDML